jgi:GntR family transcriptional regulator, transcriptional repressor for pyruvate dehydrogenase complex
MSESPEHTTLALAADRLGQIARAPRLSDAVASAILDTILAEGLKPGDSLPPERELGEHFGVSRTVVREAVRALVAKGIVEARTGSGLRVAAVEGSAVTESLSLFLRSGDVDFEHIHEVRRTIEIEMAGIAARRATLVDIDALRAIHARFASAHGDLGEAARADLEFHAAIAQATHNQLFPILLHSLGASLLQIRQRNLAGGSWDDTVAGHERILDRIARQDEDGARGAMREHLDNVADWQRRVEPQRPNSDDRTPAA